MSEYEEKLINDTLDRVRACIVARSDEVDMDRGAIGLDVLGDILDSLRVRREYKLEREITH